MRWKSHVTLLMSSQSLVKATTSCNHRILLIKSRYLLNKQDLHDSMDAYTHQQYFSASPVVGNAETKRQGLRNRVFVPP